jgi:hypothetical protein
MTPQLRDPLSDVTPEERIEQMRDELERLEDELVRARAELDRRRLIGGPGPSQGRWSLRLFEAKIAAKEARSNELFGRLNACVIGGRSIPPAGYIFCRACGAQTGSEAHYERADLCTSCFNTATNPSPERG